MKVFSEKLRYVLKVLKTEKSFDCFHFYFDQDFISRLKYFSDCFGNLIKYLTTMIATIARKATPIGVTYVE
jgi:hypothetical protein